jgi:hypothetical protein
MRRATGVQFSVSILAAFLFLGAAKAPAYSVLAHEAIIDASWDSAIKPLLMAKFPNSTADELAEARSYAYGGSIIQDLGYFPLGSVFFTNLLHYVRSGEFISAVLRDAQNENEYAFALGAMSHYYADALGHMLAVNLSVPIRYPKLRHKYGKVVTFEDGKKQHLLVEFSFDVFEVAGKAYAPQNYHDFIGFQLPKQVLERAFKDTYGLEMKDIFINEDIAIGTFRRMVSKTIPHMTRVAWAQKHDQIEKLNPTLQRNQFIYRMARRQYEADFGRDYREPSLGDRILAFLLNLPPKVLFFKFLSFQPPTPQMTNLFQQSFQAVTEQYRAAVRQLSSGTAPVSNKDLDTDKPTAQGEYALADQTYEELVDKLATRKFVDVSADLRSNILRFYSSVTTQAPDPMEKKKKKALNKLQKELAQLETCCQ